MPYETNSHLMSCSDSYQDKNTMLMVWALPKNVKQEKNMSVQLVQTLFSNEGEGSLYQSLKSLNYVSSIDCDVYYGVQTAFRLVTFELELSESGLANYKKVLAFVFEYLKKVKEEWLKDGKVLNCWTE